MNAVKQMSGVLLALLLLGANRAAAAGEINVKKTQMTLAPNAHAIIQAGAAAAGGGINVKKTQMTLAPNAHAIIQAAAAGMGKGKGGDHPGDHDHGKGGWADGGHHPGDHDHGYGGWGKKTWGAIPVPYGVPDGPTVVTSYYGGSDDGAVVATQAVLPANPPPPAARRAPNVAIVNPNANRVDLGFVMDGQSATVPRGTRMDLSVAQPQVIEFDRGGDFGRARYTVDDGLYTFTPTDHGWELYRTPYVAATDEGQ